MRVIGILASGLFSSCMGYLTVFSSKELQPVWSSLLGVSLSVFVALLALDPLQAMIESRRWSKSRKLVYPMFKSQLENLASESLINIGLLTNHKLLGSFNSVSAFDSLVLDAEDALKNNGLSNDFPNQVVEYVRHPDIVWSLDEIRTLLIPRLYLLAPNCKAVEKSLEFEASCANLIDAVIGHERVVTGAPGGAYVEFVKSMRDLYRSLVAEKYS